MIAKITSAEQAEQILREFSGKSGDLIFDLDPRLFWQDIPCVIRRCSRGHDYEYVGWNIWGKGFDKKTVYCPECGWAMTTLAEASIVIQGDKVRQLGWRGNDEFFAEDIEVDSPE